MNSVLITGATVVILQKVKPVEMIPVGFVQKNAGFVELGLGVVGTFLIKKEQPIIKGVAHGMLISGALKVVDRFVKSK